VEGRNGMIRGIVTFVVVFFVLGLLISPFGLVGSGEIALLALLAAAVAVGDNRRRARRKTAG
jgi:hypothetical protein